MRPSLPLMRRICPRDGDPLVAQRIPVGRRKVEVDACTKCHGLFLDVGEIAQLTGNRGLNRYLTTYLGIDTDSKLVCPSCGGLMDTEDCSGVIVDVCVKCKGVWLDPGELQSLQQTKEDFSTLSDDKIHELLDGARKTKRSQAYIAWLLWNVRRKRRK